MSCGRDFSIFTYPVPMGVYAGNLEFFRPRGTEKLNFKIFHLSSTFMAPQFELLFCVPKLGDVGKIWYSMQKFIPILKMQSLLVAFIEKFQETVKRSSKFRHYRLALFDAHCCYEVS